VTDVAAQMPHTTNTNSDFVSPVKLLTGLADDFLSDEILGEVEDDTPMKKNCLDMKHRQKQAMNF